LKKERVGFHGKSQSPKLEVTCVVDPRDTARGHMIEMAWHKERLSLTTFFKGPRRKLRVKKKE
jgi:hypothetical protein